MYKKGRAGFYYLLILFLGSALVCFFTSIVFTLFAGFFPDGILFTILCTVVSLIWPCGMFFLFRWLYDKLFDPPLVSVQQHALPRVILFYSVLTVITAIPFFCFDIRFPVASLESCLEDYLEALFQHGGYVYQYLTQSMIVRGYVDYIPVLGQQQFIGGILAYIFFAAGALGGIISGYLRCQHQFFSKTADVKLSTIDLSGIAEPLAQRVLYYKALADRITLPQYQEKTEYLTFVREILNCSEVFRDDKLSEVEDVDARLKPVWEALRKVVPIEQGLKRLANAKITGLNQREYSAESWKKMRSFYEKSDQVMKICTDAEGLQYLDQLSDEVSALKGV